VRGFQSVLIELGARPRAARLRRLSGAPKYRDYADFMVRHEWLPGVGPLAGFRGLDGHKIGRGEPNPDQIERYIANGGFWLEHVPPEARYFKHANADYQRWAVAMGFFECPQPVTFQLYLSRCRKFQLAAEGHGERQPPSILRERIKACFDPLPIWYPPFEGERLAGSESRDDYPLHAITQRPMATYHSWGFAERLAAPDHGWNPLYVHGGVCDEHGLEDGDWAWLISHHGRIKARIAAWTR
jgi:anaerobic selenocysteine-containing dehydrogenase